MNRLLLVFLCCASATITLGQHHLSPSLYTRDMGFLNSSATPIDSTSSYYFSLLGKKKFIENDTEIWNKPAVVAFNLAGRLGNTGGVYTAGYLRDSYSYYTRNGVYAGYVHQLKIGAETGLSFGVRGVLNADLIDWDKLKGPVGGTETSMRFSPDLELSTTFRSGGFTFGVAAQNLLETRAKYEEVDVVRNFRAFVFHSSYAFNIGRSVEVMPFALVRLKRNILADVGLQTSFYDRISLSYALRVNELRGVYAAELRVVKSFFIGFAIDRSRLYPDHNADIQARYQF